MKVVFLGTAGYYPTESRHTNCVLLKDLNIILDAGSGFFRFPRFVESDEISILLSHYHMDHICGLTQLLGLFRGKRVVIYGSKGIQEFIDTLFSQPLFAVPVSRHPFDIEIRQIGKGSFQINDTRVTAQYFTRHTYPVLGFRIESNNKTVTYITDTAVGDDEVSFARDSDLLIHECYYPEELKDRAREEKHSTTTEVANLAKKARCKKLALYHLNPSLENRYHEFEKEARQIFPHSFIPREGVIIDI